MKVLFITSSRIGDAVLTTGVLDTITRTSPHLQLAIAAGPVAMPLFDDWPHVMWRHTLIKQKGLRHWKDLWHQAKGVSWDWVIDMRGSLLSYTLRAKKRSIWKKPSTIQHRVVSISAIAGMAPAAPFLYLSDNRLSKSDDKPYVVVAPIANWMGKEWPLERFQSLIHNLLKGPMKGWRVMIMSDDYSRLMPLIKSLGEHVLQPIIPHRHLLDQAAFLKKASFFIGNDSGLMHMAAALGVPTVGLFGPSPPVLYDPYGPLGCVVRTPEPYEIIEMRRKKTPEACFMESLTVDRVYEAVCVHGYKTGSFSCVE